MEKPRKPSYLGFDKRAYPWKSGIDYRARPQLYKVGRGEQGVLVCEPYKSELLPLWHFKTPVEARKSCKAILAKFRAYLKADEFVGADMARKFLQMGYTRARRYANYKGGRKCDNTRGFALNPRGTGDPAKAESARVFYRGWRRAEADRTYSVRKKAWKATYG